MPRSAKLRSRLLPSCRRARAERGAVPSAAVDAVHRIVTDATRLSEDLGREARRGRGLRRATTSSCSASWWRCSPSTNSIAVSGLSARTPAGARCGRRALAAIGRRASSAVSPGCRCSRSGRPRRSAPDLYAGMPMAPNVIAAMSLVPGRGARSQAAIGRSLRGATPRWRIHWRGASALTRPQMELIAARVSLRSTSASTERRARHAAPGERHAGRRHDRSELPSTRGRPRPRRVAAIPHGGAAGGLCRCA